MTSERDSKISQYYKWFRNDVVSIVPESAKCVLSVGCASGVTEAELVERGIKVVGVEINHDAAEVARQRGVIVLEGDVSEIDVTAASDSYDCLIYADVLEHLQDPVTVLKRHVELLVPGGIVYICVPNFRHYSVLWQLFVRGCVNYVDAGILDRTHLKITTRKMVQNWFEQVDIEVLNSRYLMHRRRDKLASACLLGLAKEFIAEQITLVGKKSGILR